MSNISSYYHLKERTIGAWVFTIPLLVISLFSTHIPCSTEIQMVLALIVMIFFGASFYINAWKFARLGRTDMNTLIALSTSVAFLLSMFNTFFPEFWNNRGVKPDVYYQVTVIIISFILTGNLMEERAKGHASAAIRQFRGLQPETAHYLPEAERMDDRIAGLAVPVVLFLSVSTFFLWIFFGGTAMAPHALLAALSILVIACPCALGMAAPVALMAGIIRSANSHILVRDAVALEQMSKVDVVVFDKTGTPTEGRPAVTAQVVKELRGQDIDICMLTGDGERTASAAAARLGILNFVAGAMPGDKEGLIRELHHQGKTVAMVGNGMNDRQALECADVSITMAHDTEMAMDASTVTLKTSDLLLLPTVLRISRQTVRLMNKNLFWTFIYNVICIPVAAGIFYPLYGILLTPVLTIAVMSLSCISVLFNSLKVKY